MKSFIDPAGGHAGILGSLLAIVVVSLLGWWLMDRFASLYSVESLKEKCYQHPFLTTVSLFLFVLSVPYVLSASAGRGVIRLTNSFETLIAYSVGAFLLWLLFCSISDEIWKGVGYPPGWYEAYLRGINKIFAFFPVAHRFVSGVVVSVFIFFGSFIFVSLIIGLFGWDLRTLGW